MPHVTGTRSSHMPLMHSDSVMWDSLSSHLYTPCVSTEGPREEPGEEFNGLTRRCQPPCSVLPGLFLIESSQQPKELRCYLSPLISVMREPWHRGPPAGPRSGGEAGRGPRQSGSAARALQSTHQCSIVDAKHWGA